MDNAIKIGDIILLNRKGECGNIFSKSQRFFTGMPYTHCAICIGDVLTKNSVLSADELTCVLPVRNYFEETCTEIEVYNFVGDLNKSVEIINDLYNKYSGKMYGFLQILWFIYRWLMEKVGINVKLKVNPFGSGIICSELVYYYLVELGKFYPQIKEETDKLTIDTCHVGDIKNILTKIDSFKLGFSKK